MPKTQGWIVVFNSTHQVLLGEKVLKENRVNTEVIPLPRHFTARKAADCGLALRVNGPLKALIERILSTYNVDYKGIYPF